MSNLKIIQVTDTHLVGNGGTLDGLDPRERLDACVEAINAHQPDAAFCVFSGDLTDRGSPTGYEDFKQSVAGLKLEHHLMIGNHDNRETFKAAFPDTPLDENGFVQTAIDTAAGRFVLLDTHAGPTSEGAFCEQRARWLSRILDEVGARPVFLFMHHPPFDIGLPSMDRIRLLDTGAFEQAIAGRSTVRHIFLGHVHRPICGSWKGVPYSIAPATNHQVAFEFETLRPVPHSLEPPAYAMILISPETVTVHYHNYLDGSALPLPADRVPVGRR